MKGSAAILLAVVSAHAQTPVRRQFEVVSVKQNTAPPGLVDLHFYPGGRFIAVNMPLSLLIDMAYGVGTAQEHRVPGWIGSESARYDITAKAEGEPDQKEIYAMLRTMLEDRFKLQAHREKKETTLYALTVAKGGARLTAEKSGCVDAHPGDLAPSSTGAPVCGYFVILPNGLEGMKVNTAGLAGALTSLREIGRPVTDKTGIASTFDVHMRWAADGSGPSVFTALEEQLGLKLEPQKGTDDVFVIDHIERPTEN